MSKTNPPSKSAPQRSYALPVIALCFLASAVLRGEVVAKETTKALASEETMVASLDENYGHPKMQKAKCDASPFIASLKAREAEFAEREEALNAREAKLDVVTERVKKMMVALDKAKSSLADTVVQVDGAQERDIDHLVTMYSSMKAKRAGQLFNEMDVVFASELLARSKAEAAAAILSYMDPKKAFTVSVLIAQRNQSAPKN